MLVWTGQKWMTVHSPTGANLKNASLIVMMANREADQDRIKRWWRIVFCALIGFILGRVFVVILEIIANHYFS